MKLLCLWAPFLFFFWSIIELCLKGGRDKLKSRIVNEVEPKGGLEVLDYVGVVQIDRRTLRNRLYSFEGSD